MSEILAPVGSAEALTAAVNAGANAVYLGLEDFSARKNAANFTYDELFEAVKLCHYSGVSVYVAINTMVFDRELYNLSKAIEACAKADVDAIIIQDLAVAYLARQIAPDLHRHASTQMTINSLNGVLAAKELGFNRVVLSRELSYNQIKEITSGCDMEIEVFVHGALCVCLSGQCYMSAMLGGRSGNRGLCAQPCRLNFSCDGRSNVLSLKDLSLISQLESLKAIGVTSFKIEGRMKRPEYVAAAVNACKTALSGGVPDLDSLRNVFSRSGFTDGYFTDDYRNMQGIRTKEDVTGALGVLGGLKQLYHKPCKRFTADITADIKKDKPITVTFSANNRTAHVIGAVPEQAVSRALTSDYVSTQLSKLGGTIYNVGRLRVNVEEGLSVSAAELNSLRRTAVERLSEKILEGNSHRYKINTAVIDLEKTEKKRQTEIRCEVKTPKQLSSVLSEDEYSLIYAPLNLLDKNTPDKFRICVVMPTYLADCESVVCDKLKELKKYGFNKGLAHTVAHVKILKDLGYEVYGGMRLNIGNSLSLRELKKYGVKDFTLSPEIKISDAENIRNCTDAKCGIIAYGSLPLMTVRRCPVNNGKPCGNPNRPDCAKSIYDRQGNKMKCSCDKNSVEICNPDMLIMSDKQEDLNKLDFYTLRFTDEEDTDKVLNMYLNSVKPDGKLTRGLYYRGVQ